MDLNITVGELKITSLGIHEDILRDKSLAHLIPKTHTPVHCEVIISGITNAESNAIRRTIGGELLVSALTCDPTDIQTNDPFIIPEIIQKRLMSIPLDQSVNTKSTFELEVTNTTPQAIDVLTGQLRHVESKGAKSGKKLPFNETTLLLTLGAITRPEDSGSHPYIKISNITITRDYGYIPGHGMQVVAFNTASVSLDQRPPNMYAGYQLETAVSSEDADSGEKSSMVGNASGNAPSNASGNTPSSASSEESNTSSLKSGNTDDDPDILKNVTYVPSSLSDPRVWKISFNTNGTMQPSHILRSACENIIERLDLVHDLMDGIENNDDIYVLVISGESHTIGNLLVRAISDLYPNIKIVTYKVSSIDRQCTVRVRCDEDITIVFDSAIKHLKRVFGLLKNSFEG